MTQIPDSVHHGLILIHSSYIPIAPQHPLFNNSNSMRERLPCAPDTGCRASASLNQFLGDSGHWTMNNDLAVDIERTDKLRQAADLLAVGQAPPGCGGAASLFPLNVL